MRIFTSFVVVLLTVSLGLNSALLVSAQDTSLSRDFANKGDADFPSPEASLLVENFEFSGPLASNGWSAHSGIGTNPLGTTTGLTYTGYPGSGTGNAALVGNAGGEDANKPLSAEQSGNGTVVYFSALVNVNDAASDKTGDYILHIGDRVAPDGFTLFAARVFVRIVGNNVNFGLSNTSTATYGTTNFSKNTTYLLIVKYTIDTSGADPTSLWVISSGVPASEAAAGTPEVTNTTTNGQDTIDAVALRQGSGTTSAQTVVDGIRIGTTWADLTGGGGGGPLPGPKLFKANLSGAQEVPPVTTTARGFGRIVLNPTETSITASLYYTNLGSNITLAHIHGPAMPGANAGVIFDMMPATGVTSGSTINKTFAVTAQQVADLKAGLWYFNVHTVNNGNGEIRGQITRNKPRLDMDADGDSDYGIIRAGAGGLAGQATWWTSLSSGTASDPFIVQQWGLNSDVATPADFDGDGRTDHAFWRPSGAQPAFMILRSSSMTMQQIDFGLPGDDPSIVGDYSGDGLADAAVYRPGATAGAQSQFWIKPTSGPLQDVQVVAQWGLGSDIAVPGDYDGDGRFDLCVSRVISGQNTYIVFTSQGQVSYNPFGLGTDRLAPGDYNGDGITDFAVTRTEAGGIVWYYRPSGGGNDVRVPWGASTDIEAQGDYNGDGSTDFAVWRPEVNNSMFYVLTSGTGNLLFQRWGIPSDVPSIYDLHGE